MGLTGYYFITGHSRQNPSGISAIAESVTSLLCIIKQNKQFFFFYAVGAEESDQGPIL